MPFEDAVRNAALDAGLALISHIALLDESGTEIAGAGYARQTIGWDAAAAGVTQNADAESFTVPAGLTVAFIGFASSLAAGTGKDRGYTPLGAGAPMAAVVEGDDDTFTSKAHGFTDGMRVVVFDYNGAGVPTGLTEGTVYWVRDAATDTFKVSATSGGAAVNITADGEVHVQRCIPETFGAAGTLSIADGDLDISGLLI